MDAATHEDLQDLRAMVEKLRAAIEAEELPWRQPWVEVPHQNARSRKVYGLFFQISFGALGYPSAYWHTEASLRELGLVPRPLAQPRMVWGVFPTQNRNGAEIGATTKPTRVYNEAELEGPLPKRRTRAHPDRVAQPEIDQQRLDAWLAALRIKLVPSETGCFYSHHEEYARRWSSNDWYSGEIWMRPRKTFESDAAYWSTAFHEVIHWTSSPARLNRKLKVGAEELVAELGAIELCRKMGVPISPELDREHRAYLQSWGQDLAANPKLFHYICWEVARAVRWLDKASKAQESNIARYFSAAVGGV